LDEDDSSHGTPHFELEEQLEHLMDGDPIEVDRQNTPRIQQKRKMNEEDKAPRGGKRKRVRYTNLSPTILML
jgi:hypothetical protein